MKLTSFFLWLFSKDHRAAVELLEEQRRIIDAMHFVLTELRDMVAREQQTRKSDILTLVAAAGGRVRLSRDMVSMDVSGLDLEFEQLPCGGLEVSVVARQDADAGQADAAEQP